MGPTEIKNEFTTISEYSIIIYNIANDEDALFSYLDHLPNQSKEEISRQYLNIDGPINGIRAEIAKQLVEGNLNKEKIIKEFYDKKHKYPQQFAPYKNLFSIIYPFIVYSYNDKVKQFLLNLANIIQNSLNITQQTKVTKVGFDGSRFTGSTSAWFAIYNKSHPTQKTAKQLFLSIYNGKVNYALFDWKNQNKIEEFSTQPNNFDFTALLTFFNKYKSAILNDNYISDSKEVSTTNNDDKKFTMSLNTILYGPPGTGKTFKTKEIAIKIIESKI